MDVGAFENGLAALRARDYKAAERYFSDALGSIDEHNTDYNRLASYLGLARVLISDPNGLLLCRDAASNETRDGDVYLNLACAEWHNGNRERTEDAIVRGQQIDGGHTRLARASMLLESRRRNAISFLRRDHLLNRIIGRWMRRSPDRLSVHSMLY